MHPGDAGNPMLFSSRSRAELLQLLLLGAGVMALPVLLPKDPPAVDLSPTDFDQDRFAQAARGQPDIVMIGNSMTNTRLDKGLFNALVHPLGVSTVAEGGTRSTTWYFMLKNFAAAIEPPPKTVFLFFRDFDFTAPGKHLSGEHLDMTLTFMKPEDEELLEFARKQTGAQESVLMKWLPHRLAKKWRNRLNTHALDAALTLKPAGSTHDLREALKTQFDFENLRADVFDAGAIANDILPADTKQFSVDPTRNLLGRFHQTAHDRGIQLIFYRVKRRPDESNTVVQDDALRAYTEAFRSWAGSKGHLFIDETEDARLTLDMYHDGDHLAKAAMPAWTRLFHERVKSFLPPAPKLPAPAP
jgi:hypothetical protein